MQIFIQNGSYCHIIFFVVISLSRFRYVTSFAQQTDTVNPYIILIKMEPEKIGQISQQQKQSITHKESYIFKKHKPGKKYKINTTKSRAELKVIKRLIEENNWKEVRNGTEGDLMWAGLVLPDEELGVAQQIKINRIPHMRHLCDKRTLGNILNKFRQYWPQEFQFHPKTYLLPQEQEKLLEQLNGQKTFIAKPSSGSLGQGITLIKKIQDIPRYGSNDWIVQPYIDNPLLIENKKFDFRFYVLVSSIQPYICYLNSQGMARFCTEQYEKPTNQNLFIPYFHLTNYTLNKNSPKYINSDTPFGRGSKRCLRTIWEDLDAKGIDVSTLKQKIVQLSKKLMIGIYPFIKYYYHASYPKQKGKNFNLFGIDVLVDENLNPWLLEVNNNPSMSVDHETMELVGSKTVNKSEFSPVDDYIKRIVLEDSIFIALRSLEKQEDMEVGEKYYSFEKILDSNSEQLQEMNLIENMFKIFNSLCSIRNKWTLTSSQFANLSKLNGMTSQKINKNDYHLVFIKIMRGKKNVAMELEEFVEAMEYLVKQIVGYDDENKLEVMQGHLEMLVNQL